MIVRAKSEGVASSSSFGRYESPSISHPVSALLHRFLRLEAENDIAVITAIAIAQPCVVVSL